MRYEQEASSAAVSSDPTVALEYPACGETQDRSMTVYKFLLYMHSTKWMDERVVTSEKCWIGIEEKMPEISREVT